MGSQFQRKEKYGFPRETNAWFSVLIEDKTLSLSGKTLTAKILPAVRSKLNSAKAPHKTKLRSYEVNKTSDFAAQNRTERTRIVGTYGKSKPKKQGSICQEDGCVADRKQEERRERKQELYICGRMSRFIRLKKATEKDSLVEETIVTVPSITKRISKTFMVSFLLDLKLYFLQGHFRSWSLSSGL